MLDDAARDFDVLRRDSDHRLRLGVPTGNETERFNASVRERTDRLRAALRDDLGADLWLQLERLALDVWEHDRQRSADRASNVAGPYLAYTVFCTQYAAETAWEIAVPDAFVKFANRDWSYEPGYPDGYYGVRLTRDDTTVEDVPVWDVGPWNIDDNYWNPAGGIPRPRRLFTDLPQGKPEAEAAFYDDYNGGLDQFGRIVLNPGGCDLSFDVAAALGLRLPRERLDPTRVQMGRRARRRHRVHLRQLRRHHAHRPVGDRHHRPRPLRRRLLLDEHRHERRPPLRLEHRSRGGGTLRRLVLVVRGDEPHAGGRARREGRRAPALHGRSTDRRRELELDRYVLIPRRYHPGRYAQRWAGGVGSDL